MKRFVLAVLAVTGVGLCVVTAEIEALKTGYRIRQLNLKKLELVNEMKHLEFEIANLKTPQRLEQWMSKSQTKLGQSRTIELARATPSVKAPKVSGFVRLARIFLGTAQAQADADR